jgi:hypothetical protein
MIAKGENDHKATKHPDWTELMLSDAVKGVRSLSALVGLGED